MKSLGRKIACESPNLQEGSIVLRNAHTNLMNIALVLCLAHVTNTMGQAGDDFEKGDADGTRDALAVLAHLINAFRAVSYAGVEFSQFCLLTATPNRENWLSYSAPRCCGFPEALKPNLRWSD